MDFLQGEVIPFHKPRGWTSFGIVSKVRWLLTEQLGQKVKVGHAGTLDPLASGVMILCTGRATKRIEEFQQHTKEYIATLKLGATTASYDMEHPENATFSTDHITRELLEETIQKFVGRIEQIPPEYSACKIGGEHAYKLARKGEEVKLKPRVLVIEEMELLSFDMPQAIIRVVCSKGTYIRALARDIGEALQSGAYLTGLKRTRIGDVTLDQCHTLEEFPEWVKTVIPTKVDQK